MVLVWLGYVTSAARKAAEDHDVGAGAVEVQGDLTPVEDVADPVRLDHVVDQDRVVVLEQDPTGIGCGVPSLPTVVIQMTCSSRNQTPHSVGESRNHLGSETLVALADERRIGIAGGGDDYDPVQPDLAERGQTIDEIGRITHQREAL